MTRNSDRDWLIAICTLEHYRKSRGFRRKLQPVARGVMIYLRLAKHCSQAWRRRNVEKTPSEEAAFTCYEVCHPSDSMATSHQRFRIARGEPASKSPELWLSDDPRLGIVKCEV